MADDSSEHSTDESPAADPPGRDRDRSAPSDEAARQAIARAEVRFGPRIGTSPRRFRKGTCLGVVFLLMAVALAGLFFAGLLDEPDRVRYNPMPLRSAAAGEWLGRGFAIRLPEGWRTAARGRFLGPREARLSVRHGTLDSFDMIPRTFSGKRLKNRYTAAAYGWSLRKRDHGGTVEGSRYFELGSYKGAEAWLRKRDGRTIRSFAVVYGLNRTVIELRFVLPGGEGTPSWAESERIFRSLTGGLAEPASESEPSEDPAASPEREPPDESSSGGQG